jgi:3-oxoacyl-[acyl-carrier protein] reductase
MNILITGASRGIGRAIARDLTPAAKNLLLVARDGASLDSVKNEIKHISPDTNVRLCVLDAANPEQVSKLMDDISDHYGHLDALVNCAGVAIAARSLQEIDIDTWNEIFRGNMTTAFLMTKGSLPLLRASKRATVVNIASTAGISARPGWSAYAAAKAALVNFSNTIAEEFKPYKISVYCIAPGRTATELRRVLAPDEDPSTIMQPEAVAKIVSFLIASPSAQVLKGQTMIVKGE